jgi:hypothetical protein
MTPEERQMLTDLANKVAQTPAPPIDSEAEDFIRTRIGSRPDALYLMTQTVLIQNLALDQARQQIQQLQQTPQAPASQGSSSFLSGRSAAPTAPQSGGTPPPAYQTPQATGGSPAGGGSSFLRTAAQTAAGVAAGALAFEGIRSLFGGMGHMGGGLFGGGGIGGYGAPVEETVVNNYYDSPDAQGGDDSDRAESGTDDSQDYTDASDSDSDDFSGDDGSGGDFLA